MTENKTAWKNEGHPFKSSVRKERKAICLVVIVFIFAAFTTGCAPFREVCKSLFIEAARLLGVDDNGVPGLLTDSAAYWGELVWALTASDTAFIIFYYGSLNQTNYGITHRTIQTYMFGSFFIPVLLLCMFLMSLLAVLMLFLGIYSEFYILSLGTLFLQLTIVFCCISVTSRFICLRVILKAEKKQYAETLKKMSAKLNQGKQITLRYADIEMLEKDRLYHIEYIMNGTETVNERMRFIRKILDIPFGSRSKDFSEGSLYVFKSFMWKNLCFVFPQIRGPAGNTESQASLFMIYMIVDERARECSAGDADGERRKMRMEFLLFLGCVFMVWISDDNLKERWAAIDYILNKLFPNDEIRTMSLGLLLLIMNIWEKAGRNMWKTENFHRIADRVLLGRLKTLEKKNQEELSTVLYVLLEGYTETAARTEIYRMVLEMFRKDPYSQSDCLISYLLRTAGEEWHDTSVPV